MTDRLRFLLIPYSLALFLLLVGYSFLHWLLFIELRLFEPKDFIIEFVIPFTLAAFLSFFFLRPRMKILDLGKRPENTLNFRTFLAWIILSFPTLFAQAYVSTVIAKVTELESISEINQFPSTKYYILKNHHIDKHRFGVHAEFDIRGKQNEKFGMHLYIALPLFENMKDISFANAPAWLGVSYHKQISNKLDSEEKEAEYLKFLNETEKNFETKTLSDFAYFKRLGNSDERDNYLKAATQNGFYKPNKNILIGVDKPFEKRGGNILEYLLCSLLIGTLIWMLMILVPGIDKKELARRKSGTPDKQGQKNRKEFLGFFVPRPGFLITPILIGLNMGVFLLMVIMGLGFLSFETEDLLKWGANYGPSTKNGEWWRLLTCTFLHGGLVHLLANMYALLYVGFFLEPLLGRTRYLLAYLLSGVLASLASIYWYEATVSIGASGAVFGLYGVMLAMLLTKAYHSSITKPFLTSIAIFIVFNLLIGMHGGIDNAAHIGGLLAGFVIGLLLRPTLKSTAK